MPEATVPAPDTNLSRTPDRRIGRRRTCVAIGFVLVLAAWLTMMWDFRVSIGCTVAGLVLSIIGVRIPPSPARNLAITAIVAGCVLTVVYLLFSSIFLIF